MEDRHRSARSWPWLFGKLAVLPINVGMIALYVVLAAQALLGDQLKPLPGKSHIALAASLLAAAVAFVLAAISVTRIQREERRRT